MYLTFASFAVITINKGFKIINMDSKEYQGDMEIFIFGIKSEFTIMVNEIINFSIVLCRRVIPTKLTRRGN